MIKTYIQKVSPFEAVQWTGDNIDEIIEFTNGDAHVYMKCLFLNTVVGEKIANTGDYILRSSNGKYERCDPMMFKELYEEVESNA